jgi:hypothetical protein
MTDTVTSQNIDLSSWDTLYNPEYKATFLFSKEKIQLFFNKIE